MNKNTVPNKVSAGIPAEYEKWREELETLIEKSKLKAVIGVNVEMLSLYWAIGRNILEKQKESGWGAQVIDRLSADLSRRFPDDRGYSVRNLKNMRSFAKAYPHYPIVQVPLAQLSKLPVEQTVLARLQAERTAFVQVSLAQISWYHHISLMTKVKDNATRAFYILETVANGWSRGISQPMGIAQYEMEKLFADVASSLPQIEDEGY